MSSLSYETIDAQIHLWLPESPQRRWPSFGRAYAHGNELKISEALSMMDEAGVDRAILVPPSWEGDRNDYCISAAHSHPDRFAVMGRFPVEDPNRLPELEQWKSQPGMLGIRLTFHNEVQRKFLLDGTADWFWPIAEKQQIPLMIFSPSLLREVGEIAVRFPKLKIVIDHLGLIGRQPDNLLTQLAPVLQLADHPNVAVKASCMPSLVNENFPFPSLHDPIKTVVEHFGPARTFWGSDISRLPCTWSENIRLFTEACTFLSDSECEWIMGRGISNWLDWNLQSS